MTANALTVIEPSRLTAMSADQNPAAVYLASLTSAHSKRTMRAALDTIAAIISGGHYDEEVGRWGGGQHTAATLPWGELRFQHTAAIRAVLAEHYKYTTANKILSALRGVLKVAYKLGTMTPDDYAKASDIGGIKGQSVPAGRDLSRGEIAALAQACSADLTLAGARDKAMIAILYACGLRRAELVALDLADYESESGKLTVRSGKGGKDRTVYAANGAKLVLEVWLARRDMQAGPLFWAIGRGNKLIGQRMTTQAVYNILLKRAKEAGVKDFSPHDMRRTFVGDMLDAGADISTVAKLAGHASVTTTARYDRRSEDTKRKAAGLLHFPA